MNELDFVLAFSNTEGIGPKSYLKLLKVFKNASDAWNNSSEEKYKKAGIGKVNYSKFYDFKKQFDVEEYKKKLRKAKVEFIALGDKYYPDSLKSIDNPPIGLYVKGNKNLLLSSKVIAVVGTRKTTSYGRQVTENLVIELVSNGFVIVSGMALGVDGIAHNTAIECNGSTIAVLGCGVDCPYPKENERLYEEILDSNGLVISEYPLGKPANPGTFPARNRIVSALSSSVLITEAAEDSGSLITADLALKQGKIVFAVPGPITSQMSRGAIKLLKEGAILVQSANDILKELRIKNLESSKSVIANEVKQSLKGAELKIYECIQNEEKSIDEISKETKIPLNKLSVVLSEMELDGIINNSDGKFRV